MGWDEADTVVNFRFRCVGCGLTSGGEGLGGEAATWNATCSKHPIGGV